MSFSSPRYSTRCLGDCIMNTTNMFSLGSTQKYVPPAPPQLYSPTEPAYGDTPASLRTAKPSPKPKPVPGRQSGPGVTTLPLWSAGIYATVRGLTYHFPPSVP